MSSFLRFRAMAVVAIVLFAATAAFAQTSCPGFKTFTQGGWGSTPTGNNPGTFLNNNFAANFPAPTYLTIGCTNKLQLTSASAVRAFLPNGTTPYVLPAGTLVNKTKTNYSNVFAGQLVALALNLRFDTNIASFGSSTTNLKDLVIASGPFIGKTVQFLFDEANKKIGGCAAFNATLSQYTTAIDNVNRNYDNGTNSQSFLVCPLTTTCSAAPALCYGGNGSMTVTVNGGRAPFNYSWSNGAAGNVASANLPAGTYTVTVTDASLQTVTTTCTITQPTEVIAAAVVNGDILCNGGTTTVTVSATGGTGSYTGTGTFTVEAGSYTYTVTDTNGCSKSVSVNVTEPSALVAQVDAGQILCNGGTTVVVVSANGGTPSYSGTGSFTVGAGTYTYTVIDSNGCTDDVTVEVTEPTQLVAAAVVNGDILCNGGTTTVTVSADGGTPDYNGTGTFTVGAGSYSYDVTDANGCPASTSVEIAEPALLEVALTVEQRVTCYNDCNGVIISTVNGGTGAYSYAWSNGSTDSSIGGLCADSYGLTVTDANGCDASAEEVVLDNPTPILSTTIETIEDSNCEDAICDGSILVSVSGGEPLYSYQWTEGNSGESDGEISLSEICEGFYELIVTDNRGCMDTVWTGFIGCRPGDCGPHKTFTQGGWGAVPNGNNPGVYLHANFDAAYPSGLTIGCGDNTLSFYSAQEVTDFLPEGGTPDALPSLSVLTGQLVAASLNVGFDAYDADFAGSPVALGDMFTDAAGFEGMTVADIVAAANEVIGGCSDAFGYSALNAVLTTINENFDNGTQDNGHLTCSNESGAERNMEVVKASEASSFMLNVYPNPAVDVANVQISATRAEIFDIALYSMTGQMVVSCQRSIPAGTTTLDLQVSELPAMTYVLRVTSANQNKTQVVEVR
jgi:Secretion system C-terminal sorting domain/SprB repeat